MLEKTHGRVIEDIRVVKRRRVLIAEDDAPVAAMLLEIFTQLDYEVSAAVSLEQTLEVAARVRPGVVLVGLDGYGNFEPGWRAATMLARMFPGSHLVMIATSDAAVAEVGQTPRGRTFTAALLKPFELDQLIALIDRLYQSHDASIAQRDTSTFAPPRRGRRAGHGGGQKQED